MNVRFVLALALSLATARRAVAQQPLFVRDTDRVRVEIRARGGRVEVVSRWSHGGDPVLLVHRDTIVQSPSSNPTIDYPAQAIRLFLSPDTAYRFVRAATRELAAPDSVRFAKDMSNLIRLTVGGATRSRAEAYREPPSNGPSRYYVAFGACRGEKVAMITSRENWRSIVDGLRIAADSAARQNGSIPRAARHSRSAAYGVDDIPCPARPRIGNATVPLDSQADFLSRSRMTALDFIIDSGGMVLPNDVRRVEGDSALFVAAARTVSTWRFTPALFTDRQRVAQRARLLVVDRGPTSRAESLQLFERARSVGAQFVTVAARQAQRTEGTRTITSADGARRIHMLTFGYPAQIAFIPDLGGRASDWRQVALDLEPTLPSLTYDLRGHAESSRSRDVDYSLDAQVADLRDVIDSTMVAFQIVVGVGSSCAIATEYARRFPRRVLALVLIAPNSPDHARGAVPTMSRAYTSSETRYRLDYLDVHPSLFGGPIDDNERELRQLEMLNRLRSLPPDVHAESLESLRDYDVASAVAGYPGKTYVLFPWGTSGIGYTVEGPLPMLDWPQAIPRDSSRVKLSRLGVGSAPHVLEPAQLTKWLTGLLTELHLSGGS